MALVGQQNSTVLDKVIPEVADGIFQDFVALDYLKEKCELKRSGKDAIFPVMYAKSPVTKVKRSTASSATITMAQGDIVDSAKYSWSTVVTPVEIPYYEDRESGTDEEKVDIIATRYQNAVSAAMDEINRQVILGAGSASTETDGFGRLVDDTTAVGGLDPATETWWKAYVEPAAAFSVATLRKAFYKIKDAKGKVDMILGSSDFYNTLAAVPSLVQNVTTGGYTKRIVDLGFEGMTFEGATVGYDIQVDTLGAPNKKRAYLLSSKALGLHFQKNTYFKRRGKVQAYNKLTDGEMIVTEFALGTGNRRQLGVYKYT